MARYSHPIHVVIPEEPHVGRHDAKLFGGAVEAREDEEAAPAGFHQVQTRLDICTRNKTFTFTAFTNIQKLYIYI